jgi:hypothetical protein
VQSLSLPEVRAREVKEGEEDFGGWNEENANVEKWEKRPVLLAKRIRLLPLPAIAEVSVDSEADPSPPLTRPASPLACGAGPACFLQGGDCNMALATLSGVPFNAQDGCGSFCRQAWVELSLDLV